MLENLKDNALVGEASFEELRSYVLARTDALMDAGPMRPQPNQRKLLSRELLVCSGKSRKELVENLRVSGREMQCVRHDGRQEYVPWRDAVLPLPPAQTWAFEQLQF